EVFADLPQLCPSLHLPIQSGSDRILAAMGRGHSADDYCDWVDRLRQARPDLAMASDFIVGFPGESEQDFQQTLDLVDRVGFDHAYSFRFSARPGTAAAQMGPLVADAVAAERLQRLQQRLEQWQLQSNRKQVGRHVAVLVEGPSRMSATDLAGRTPDGRAIHFPVALEDTSRWIGQIVTVTVTEGLPNSLRGRLTGDG
ncbi:MAG: TRAM domain-containing protein, partial [Magnetococcales bacterium]|nr:TRAM domain-containing protein [Magnetococcales bacterium]